VRFSTSRISSTLRDSNSASALRAFSSIFPLGTSVAPAPLLTIAPAATIFSFVSSTLSFLPLLFAGCKQQKTKAPP
jgi:hypothetical protein